MFALPGTRLSARTRRPTGLAAALALSVLVAAGHAQPAATATQVKAAFLYNFTQFATWPASSFEGAESPFRVCTLGVTDVTPELVEILRSERVGDHPLTVVAEPSRSERRSCHILFVSAQAQAQVADALEDVSGAPVLTVGESGGFVRRGGALEFMLDGGRVRFDVNLPAALTRGITLSSRLLQVARKVQR